MSEQGHISIGREQRNTMPYIYMFFKLQSPHIYTIRGNSERVSNNFNKVTEQGKVQTD